MSDIIMPDSLTAENGAKAALIGEFYETIECECPECHGEGYFSGYPMPTECNHCKGCGISSRKVLVS